MAIALKYIREASSVGDPTGVQERDFFIDNLLVRVHLIIEMIGWTGLAP